MLKRGEVYEVSPGPSVGKEIQKKRPCVIVSAEVFNLNSGLVVVIPLTDAEGKSEDILHIGVPRKEGGLSKDSIALCDQIKAVDQGRTETKLGNLNPETMRKIDRGIKAVLGF
jgi:mRNA interferase MazF